MCRSCSQYRFEENNCSNVCEKCEKKREWEGQIRLKEWEGNYTGYGLGNELGNYTGYVKTQDRKKEKQDD